MSRKVQLTMDIVFPVTAPSWIDMDNISRNNIFFLPNHYIYSDFKLHVKYIIGISVLIFVNLMLQVHSVFLCRAYSGTILRATLRNRRNRKMRNIQLQSKLTMIRVLGMVFLSIQTVAGNGGKEV